ncbi:MAG: YybH family protein [Acidobacteriota bacterium]
MNDPRSIKASQAALMVTADDTEASFYDSLQHGDLDRLMSVWSEDDEIACVHPGGPRAVGLAAIRASFEAVLSQGALQVTAEQVRRLETATCAIHHVTEKIQAMTPDGLQVAYVMATNVYLRTSQGWRMVLHHASPGQPHDMPDVTELGATLH